MSSPRSIGLGVALAAASLLCSCLEAREGASGTAGDAAADASDSAIADSGKDSAEPDAPAQDTKVAPDTCRVATSVERQGIIEFETWDSAFRPIALEDATLFGVRRTAASEQPFAQQIVAVDLPSGDERVLVGEGDNALLDAGGGAILYTTVTADQTTELHHRDLASGVTQTLFTSMMLRNGSQTMLVPGRYGFEGGGRLIEGGAAVWGETSYGAQPVTRVRMLRGQEVVTLWEGDTQITAPYLRDDNVLFVTYASESTLWLARAGARAEPIAKGQIAAYALSGDAAWWLDRAAVYRQGLGGEPRRVHEGPCGMLVADDERALSVCGKDVGEGWYAAFPGRPVVFRGGEHVELETRGGETIAGLALAGAHVAWVEYAAEVGCGTIDSDIGELVLGDLERPKEPQLVASVGAGCWCCDAYWPLMEVALSAAGLAWGYPISEAPRFERVGAVGWGLFVQSCR